MSVARKIALFAMALAFLVIAGAAGAADVSIPLKAEKDSPAASGTAALSESPFGKWSMIMVVRHPTGDPADMKNMVPALSAGIPKKD